MSGKASATRIVEELRALGSESYRNTLRRHGIKEPVCSPTTGG
jgi:hypothetical protein